MAQSLETLNILVMNHHSSSSPKVKRPHQYIREWRLHRGLTQERLAARVGMSPGAISQLENGHINYTQPRLEALAEALSCAPGDLLDKDPNLEAALSDLMQLIHKKDRKTVLAILRGLPDKTGTGE
jgi:transcriptional regulator with XRE-family HTH domain